MTLPSMVVITEIPSLVSTEIISTTMVITKIPPLVSTKIVSTAPSTLPSGPITEEGSASVVVTTSTNISLDTSALIPITTSTTDLVPPKPKGTKKSKTVSRVLVDPATKRKYVEVIVPSSDKSKDNIQPEDYTMQTVDLGVEMHESVKLDSQTDFNSLL
ncbi:uncharacterized protein LOC131876666 [Cryptomeria japonica]|uniref:uncharacterized protein LOC131876666 n=1 Tax=Cryptomeria japonica TaxID=3369 RepID=UPI0027DA1560|nr:uncharacterized protein LOC131876666 [Cryptomeria japonica]